MATNKILPFASSDSGTNLLTDAQYTADAQRTIGHQPGVARAQLANKQARQTSAMAAGLGQFVADNQADDVADSDTPPALSTKIANAIKAVMKPVTDLFYLKTGGKVAGDVEAQDITATGAITAPFVKVGRVEMNTDGILAPGVGKWVATLSANNERVTTNLPYGFEAGFTAGAVSTVPTPDASAGAGEIINAEWMRRYASGLNGRDIFVGDCRIHAGTIPIADAPAGSYSEATYTLQQPFSSGPIVSATLYAGGAAYQSNLVITATGTDHVTFRLWEDPGANVAQDCVIHFMLLGPR